MNEWTKVLHKQKSTKIRLSKVKKISSGGIEATAYRRVDLTPIAARTFSDSSLMAIFSVLPRIRIICTVTVTEKNT